MAAFCNNFYPKFACVAMLGADIPVEHGRGPILSCWMAVCWCWLPYQVRFQGSFGVDFPAEFGFMAVLGAVFPPELMAVSHIGSPVGHG